ncbi:MULTISPECIES: serine O-acetyltransferase EpsC [Bradyrhizobium]|uniref:Serine acetyltransferase n=1 Tax=Bradyrhizobium stylosanthis TaxID=1803665 RepID=A0A560DB37_9BRAD|nr:MULTISPECIES: serine O-acetyltransferase EpsC [Bradyrhizobium]MBR1177904.1 serine acetyltransferase [Bradyrhizobium sp. KB893862 SZCCT0404]TWA94314.1 serine O-acetyltransferase [Bradyrhizobium stylosanthis]
MTQKTKIVDKIKEDLAHYASREHTPVTPAFVIRMLLLTPGFQFVFAWRIQEALFRVPLVGRILRRIVWWFSCLLFGSEIALAANVDGGLYIPHPYGIVVGASDIGKRVTLLQHITIGRKDHSDRGRPRIEDGASLMAGCVVLGSITIGSNSMIGANAVVLKDVPPNSIAVGAPAKILPRSDVSPKSEDALQGLAPEAA